MPERHAASDGIVGSAGPLACGLALAAMGGLRPVVEVMLVDFFAVAWSAVLNAATKIPAFSGGRVSVPMVIRAACGGGYGDGGQHEQNLWGALGGQASRSTCRPPAHEARSPSRSCPPRSGGRCCAAPAVTSARVALESVPSLARHLEDDALPNVDRIMAAIERLA